MLLITQSQGLGSNFDVDFQAGVIWFSQDRFWGTVAGGEKGVGEKLEPAGGRPRAGGHIWRLASGREVRFRGDGVDLDRSLSLQGLSFPSEDAETDGSAMGWITQDRACNFLTSGQTLHSFMQPVFIEHLLYAGACFWPCKLRREHDKQPPPPGLAEETVTKQ